VGQLRHHARPVCGPGHVVGRVGARCGRGGEGEAGVGEGNADNMSVSFGSFRSFVSFFFCSSRPLVLTFVDGQFEWIATHQVQSAGRKTGFIASGKMQANAKDDRPKRANEWKRTQQNKHNLWIERDDPNRQPTPLPLQKKLNGFPPGCPPR